MKLDLGMLSVGMYHVAARQTRAWSPQLDWPSSKRISAPRRLNPWVVWCITHMAQGLLQWDACARPPRHVASVVRASSGHLSDKASPVYLDSLRAMSKSLTSDSVPRIEAMEAQLQASTGWSLTVVPV